MNFCLLKALMGSLLVSHVVFAAKPDNETSESHCYLRFLAFTTADGIHFLEGMSSSLLGYGDRQSMDKTFKGTAKIAGVDSSDDNILGLVKWFLFQGGLSLIPFITQLNLDPTHIKQPNQTLLRNY